MAVQDPDNLLLALLTLAAAAVGSAAVRTSDSWGRTARVRADQRAAELATAAATAVRADRLAVARELHDLVSHAVGVMVMQAGAALVTHDGDPERARRALDVVRRTAADAQHELDRLVAVLDSGVLAVGRAMAELDTFRSRYMRGRSLGLTGVYNLVDNPACSDAEVMTLRDLHAALDDAVVRAYGWDDLLPLLGHGHHGVPKFGIRWTLAPETQRDVERRLLMLNLSRAGGEAH